MFASDIFPPTFFALSRQDEKDETAGCRKTLSPSKRMLLHRKRRWYAPSAKHRQCTSVLYSSFWRGLLCASVILLGRSWHSFPTPATPKGCHHHSGFLGQPNPPPLITLYAQRKCMRLVAPCLRRWNRKTSNRTYSSLFVAMRVVYS